MRSADVQSQSNAERRQAVAVVRTHGRGAVAVERARTTNSRTHARTRCSRRADDRQSSVPHMRDTVRAVPQISMPTQSNTRTDRQHTPCTHLCPACLIAQLDTKSVTDTPRATCVHMPACPLAIQLAFPWALPMRTHVPHMPRQFSRPVCASVDIPMDQLP